MSDIDRIEQQRIAERARLIGLLPPQPQAQYSLEEQLETLHGLANRAGLYDAADFIRAQYLTFDRRPDFRG